MRTDVLIAGGSLSGLSASVFLTQHGVDHQVVERHPGTAVHPRINGVSPRSMELFDSVGLGSRIRAAGRVGDQLGEFYAAESLAADDYQPFGGPEDPIPDHLSPTGMCACDQDVLEPILCDHLELHGAKPQFGTELVEFVQSADEVVATLRDRATGEEETVAASYLIAADGMRSGIRERLHIGRHGAGLVESGISIVFRADLEPALRGRLVYAVFGEFGTFVRRREDLWQLVVPYDPATEAPDMFTEQRCLDLIRSASGLPDVDATIVTVSPLEMRAEVADRFHRGRVFLVGDAAHPSPPAGGLGGNMCVQDAHNLAWKLAAVLRGRAHPRLLDTYDPERRPIAELTIGVQLADLAPEHETARDQDYATIVFGHRYSSPAVITNGQTDSHPLEDPRTPSGNPGTRAAHLVLEQNGRRLSTLDLVGPEFTLLAGPEGAHWRDVAQRVSPKLDLELAAHVVGKDFLDVENRWPTAYGTAPTGAVLIRPDGFIGWRTNTTDHADHHLEQALNHILSRSTAA